MAKLTIYIPAGTAQDILTAAENLEFPAGTDHAILKFTQQAIDTLHLSRQNTGATGKAFVSGTIKLIAREDYRSIIDEDYVISFIPEEKMGTEGEIELRTNNAKYVDYLSDGSVNILNEKELRTYIEDFIWGYTSFAYEVMADAIRGGG